MQLKLAPLYKSLYTYKYKKGIIMNEIIKLVQLIIEIPEGDRYEIKRRALKKGITLKKWVLQAILEKIKEEKKYE